MAKFILIQTKTIHFFAYGKHWIYLRLQTVATISKNTKKFGQQKYKKNKSCVMSHVSHVNWYVSHILCSLSPVTDINSHSHRPYLSMHSRLVCKDQKLKFFKIFKKIETVIISDILFGQKSPVHREAVFPGGGETLTLQLNRSSGWCSENDYNN